MDEHVSGMFAVWPRSILRMGKVNINFRRGSSGAITSDNSRRAQQTRVQCSFPWLD